MLWPEQRKETYLCYWRAEHKIFQLQGYSKAPGPSFSNEQLDDLRCDLYRLMGISDATKYCGMVDQSKSVSELLSAFSVGTESAKAPPAPPPLDTVFLPMRMYTFQNPSQQCINKVKENHLSSKRSGSNRPKTTIKTTTS